MTDEAKARLKNVKRSECSQCGTKQSYTNPMRRCHECKKMCCFDHIFGCQTKKGMGVNEEGRSVCRGCKEKFGYVSI